MRALAAGPGAVRALSAGGSGSLEVAIGAGGYVRLGDAGWLLLATPRAPVGPLSLLVSGLGGARAEAGWRARVDDDVLVVGPHRIAHGGLAALSSCAVPRGIGAAAVPDRPPPPRALMPGLRALRRGDLEPAVALLAGRGDGLTPAGDDVLAGYAGWMAAAGTPVRLASLAADRSPPIGIAYLRCAERGELPEPAVRLLEAVAAGDEIAARRRARVLRRWGASSGQALIWGFAAGAAARVEHLAPG